RLSLLAIRPGRSCAGGVTSQSMSPVPAWICFWTLSWVRPSVTFMWSTYACRSESVFGSQAGLRSSWNSFVGTYLTIWYGPSESVCCRNWALSGTYFMYSTGLAEEKPIARMLGKSGAGFVRRKAIVRSFFATRPGTGWPLTYAAIAGAVGFT